MPLVPVQTGDGTRTLFCTERQLHFRSLQGAGSESSYVFLESSQLLSQPDPVVLELGLGTALNFLTTAAAVLRAPTPMTLDYHVVELQPLSASIFEALKYTTHFPAELVSGVLTLLQQVANEPVRFTHPQIRLTLYPGAWSETPLPAALAVDAIYHDPFGPKDNPECWTPECFTWSGRHLKPTGRLVTYAAATSVRKALVAAGLVVASLPGSGRKREMTVAARSASALEGTQPLRQSRYQ
ncbi:MAG: tRNA (5-methylaminomethyl-2-thiouridine)(34)-methyltransferase MnmD [Candidatus Sericytochromatia bacterium]|nr:tRNA (5-methylaminomethyl-2-thiouridine)(34)-methyltransferase MnmD [Candidatus Sericytochromatia bacterium]